MFPTSCSAFSRITIHNGVNINSLRRRPHHPPHLLLVGNRKLLFPSQEKPNHSPSSRTRRLFFSQRHPSLSFTTTHYYDEIAPNRQLTFLGLLSRKPPVPSSLSRSVSMTFRSNFMARLMSSSSSSSSSRDDFGKKKQKQIFTQKEKSNESNNTLPDNTESIIEQETRDWVTRVVVGMNLCPFAAKPVLSDQQLYVSVVRGGGGCQQQQQQQPDDILRSVLIQALVLTGADALPGTALVVCPDLYPHDFQRYLTVLSMIVDDGLLVDHDLEGQVQVVPFHPKFVFAAAPDENEDEDEQPEDNYGDDDEYLYNVADVDKDDNDDSNYEAVVDDDENLEYWTNRSPYPMFHILKEEDVSRAVQIMKGDTDRVWQRNVFLLQRLQELCSPTTSKLEKCASAASQSTTTQSSEPISKQTLLERYLTTGADDEDQTFKSMIQQALQETAMEFPMLKNPIPATKKGSIPDGDGPREGGKGSLG